MAQYIDKNEIKDEIKRLIDSNKSLKTLDPTYYEGLVDSLDDVLSFLDTLEVKEVDLEKEISNYLDNHNLNIQDGGRIVFNNGDTPNFLCDFRDIAKHFFELGLKAKGE